MLLVVHITDMGIMILLFEYSSVCIYIYGHMYLYGHENLAL